MNAPEDFRLMTADTIGKDLLSALVAEIKLLPDPRQKLSKAKQDDIIDRLRNRVETNVKMAVYLLAAEGRVTIAGDLDQITIKDGVKAVVKFGTGAANLHELYDVAGKAILLVVANAADHTGGMNDIAGESDQRAMELGHEYDPNGDGKGMDSANDGDAIEGEVLGLPFIDREDILDAPPKTARLGDAPNDAGVYTCEPDERLKWGTKKDRVEIELLELENGKWLYATEIRIGANHSSGPLGLRHGVAESRKAALRAVQSRLVNIYAKGEDSGIKGAALKDFANWVNSLVNDGNDEPAA